MIRYIRRRQIDEEHWNSVIASSGFETIYPYTWYLDACADHWAAFVMEDYACIMPVVFRKKIGMKYTYQPVYCQQLGIFSDQPVDVEVTRMFLRALQKKFRMGDYALNEGNMIGEEHGFEVTDNMNYVLPLDRDYDTLRRNYADSCRRTVKRTTKNDLRFTDEIGIDELISLKKNSTTPVLNNVQYAYIKELLLKMKSLEKLRIYGAREKDHLVAAAAFAFSAQRGIYLLSASSAAGREHQAMFMVVDQFIQLYAEKLPKLDFEGSNIPSIARFFRGFGAKPEVYQRVSFQNPMSNLAKKLRRV